MRFVVKMIFAAHVLNETLDAVKLSHVVLNEIPNFKKCLILIRCNHCHEPVDMGGVIALVFGACHK